MEKIEVTSFVVHSAAAPEKIFTIPNEVSAIFHKRCHIGAVYNLASFRFFFWMEWHPQVIIA